MVDFRINVIVDPTQAKQGSKEVQSSLKDTETAADRLRGTLVKAFAGLGVAALIGKVKGVIDTYSSLQNRLSTVTNGQEELNNTFDALVGIANRTRSGLDGVVTLYQRGSIAAKELGASQAQLLKFVERVGQGLAIQGGSAATSAGALIQLSQALGSGTVRAEEFNSVLEGAFPIAQAVARGLNEAGGSVGKLRTLITKGKVSSQEFFNAFLKGSEELSNQFSKTTPTISQAFTVLGNSLLQSIGGFDKAVGASEAFAQILLLVAENMDVVVTGAKVVAAVLGVLLLGKVTALITQFKALTVAIAANPIGLIVVAGAAAGTALLTLRDRLDTVGGGLDDVKKKAEEALQPLLRLQQISIDGATRFEQIPTRPGVRQGPSAFGPEGPPKLSTEDLQATVTRLNLVDQTAAKVQSSIKGVIGTAIQGLQDLADRAGEAQFLQPLDDEADALRAVIAGNKALADTLGIVNQARSEGINLDKAEIEGLIRRNELLAEQAQIIQELRGPGEDLNRRTQALKGLLDEGRISLEEFNTKLREAKIVALDSSMALEDGFSRAFLRIQAEAEDFASVGESVVGSFADNATNAIATFVETGKFAFGDLARSILSDLAQILARLLVVQAISAFLPGAGAAGAAGGALTGLGSRQEGGTVQPGRSFVVGEKGPELFVPDRTGTVVPNGGEQQAPVTNIQNVVIDDPMAAISAMETPAGERVVLNIIDRRRTRVKRSLT